MNKAELELDACLPRFDKDVAPDCLVRVTL